MLIGMNNISGGLVNTLKNYNSNLFYMSKIFISLVFFKFQIKTHQ